jgi:hypothetical protein
LIDSTIASFISSRLGNFLALEVSGHLLVAEQMLEWL